jgi:hypothetical protein
VQRTARLPARRQNGPQSGTHPGSKAVTARTVKAKSPEAAIVRGSLKFDASIFGRELPVGLGVVGIAVVLPGGDFVDEDLFVGNAAIEALGG